MSGKINHDKYRHDKKRGGDYFIRQSWNKEYEEVKLPPTNSTDHSLIYVRVRKNITDDFFEKVWNKPSWTKKMIFDKIKEMNPNWYSIEVFSIPRNTSLDDIFWKNPNYKINDKKITKLESEFK